MIKHWNLLWIPYVEHKCDSKIKLRDRCIFLNTRNNVESFPKDDYFHKITAILL